MSGVFFQPWIGENYSSHLKFGKKILVLGESHYQWDENQPPLAEWTRDRILEQLDGRWPNKFWTNIAVAFLNGRPTLQQKKEFWHSIAFYNYIQASVGFGPRVPPLTEMWKQSELGLSEVLDLVTPQVVIVLGYRLWNKLLPLNHKTGPAVEGAKQATTRYYPFVGGGACLAYGICHPSAGFSGRYWYPFILQAISLA